MQASCQQLWLLLQVVVEELFEDAPGFRITFSWKPGNPFFTNQRLTKTLQSAGQTLHIAGSQIHWTSEGVSSVLLMSISLVHHGSVQRLHAVETGYASGLFVTLEDSGQTLHIGGTQLIWTT